MGKKGGGKGSGRGGQKADSDSWLLPAAVIIAGVAASWFFSASGTGGPALPVDRVNPILAQVSPAGDKVTDENGRAIAKALNLQKWMEDIVASIPDAELVNSDPPVILFKNFMTKKECRAMIKAGEPGLAPSTGTGELKDGKFERTTIQGRTSYNAWCMHGCENTKIAKTVDARIANVTGFAPQNMEYYQILRYKAGQEYQAHSDWIEQQKYQPSGPRMFTFFLYLNEVEEGGGGSTWFPQARTNSSGPVDTSAVHMYYEQYNQVAARKAGIEPPSEKFADQGFRVRPTLGSAIMWPNADFENVYQQHPSTMHSAEPLMKGHQKWAANAWIHLRDFRTPHASGQTG